MPIASFFGSSPNESIELLFYPGNHGPVPPRGQNKALISPYLLRGSHRFLQTGSLTLPRPFAENTQTPSTQPPPANFGPLRGNRAMISPHRTCWRREDCGSECQKRARSTLPILTHSSRLPSYSRERMPYVMNSPDSFQT